MIIKEIESLEMLQNSIENKSGSNRMEPLVDNVSERDLLSMQGFRKRDGTLNYTKVDRNRLLLYSFILIIILCFFGLFICKHLTVQVLEAGMDS